MSCRPVNFRGTLPASKSLLNRVLVIQNYSSNLVFRGDSQADDVVRMKQSLKDLSRGLPADCGSAGTTLRFLAFRAARMEGIHVLCGHEKLFQRPQREIVDLLAQLGVRAELGQNQLKISGQGWQLPRQSLVIDRQISSQFASAVLLNAWGLALPLRIEFRGELVSEGYFEMTLALVKRAGMSFNQISDRVVEVARLAKVEPRSFDVEPDLSSAFAVAALAVASGGVAQLESWPDESLQPDVQFVEILRRMGCVVEHSKTEKSLLVKSAGSLSGVEANLNSSPDLFPVLATLCAFANSPSRLFGAPQLAHKESSRIQKTAELLSLIGAEFDVAADGMNIRPRPIRKASGKYDCENDHRLAMAAAVAVAGGCMVDILNPQVVSKSFPEFWTIARGALP